MIGIQFEDFIAKIQKFQGVKQKGVIKSFVERSDQIYLRHM